MKCPDKVQLSRADGEAIRTRLVGDALTADDRQVLDQVLQWYFWLLFALQEATCSLKRLQVMLFGAKPKQRQSPSSSGSSDGGGGAADVGAASTVARASTAEAHRSQRVAGGHRPGQRPAAPQGAGGRVSVTTCPPAVGRASADRSGTACAPGRAARWFCPWSDRSRRQRDAGRGRSA